MINKISLNATNGLNKRKPKPCQPLQPQAQANVNNTTLMDSAAAATLKPLSFKGCTRIESDGDKGVRINDFIGKKDDIMVTTKNAGTTSMKKTDAGFEIEHNGKTVFHAEFKNANDLPEITYKAGKFKPEITIHDKSLKGGRIQMFAGSKIEAANYTLTMPGEADDYKTGSKVSFKGRFVVTAFNFEDKTKNAVDKYVDSGLASQTTQGEYADFMKEQDPTIVIPAGGFGTRFVNMTEEEGENKPSFRLPTDNNYRIMATALNMGAMSGLIGNENDSLTYVSQAKDANALEAGENVYKSKAYKTDGGAIAEAIDKGIVPQDKDAIVLNADIITNADITRAYHALKTLPNAALVIPYYPVNAERAKSFGLIGTEDDGNGNKIIKEFIEKPPYTDAEPPKEGFKTTDKYNTYEKVVDAYEKVNKYAQVGDGNYLGNPGIYVMSKEAAGVLKDLGIEDPSKTGLGASVMPTIVEMCAKGELKNEKGEPMKVYTVPLERKDGQAAFWDDIGSAEAYLKTVKDIAVETNEKGTGIENKYYGIPEFVLKDFANNFDAESGVLYMSQKAEENAQEFGTKYGATLQGNIFVAD